LNLTPKEFALLELFLRNPSQVFSRRAILDSLWSLSDAPGEETVTSHMKGLRRKLSKGGAPADFIDTVYGVGYRLKPTLTSIDAESPPLPLSADDMDRHRKIKTKAALATLWNSVKRHQLARLDQLKQTLAHLRAGQLTEDMRSAGYRAAHGLTGILGIFGLTEGSQTACKIQTLLSDPLLAGSNYAQLADQLATLTESLDHTLSQSTQLSETLLAVPHTPLLVIVDPQLGLMSELARRLQKKGLTVKKISNPTGLQTLLQALNPTGDSQSSDRTQNQQPTSQGAVPEVVLLDAALPTLLPSQVADLAGILHQVPSLMAIVCSADGSLPSRVTALQLGNYPFLHNPDIGEIVNGIVQLRQSPQTPALKLLVVDDDPEILAVLRTRLEPQGFQIATLNQPVAFWQTLQAVSPDLILLDISMPDFSGIELCKAVRQAPSWSHVPIVFFTSDADAQMQKRAFRAGADDLVEKSLPSSELLIHLYKQMKRSHLQQAITAITHGTLSPSP
ncbi:MAG: response regulator, partial [Cyanobacteria bacterium J06607_13]